MTDKEIELYEKGHKIKSEIKLVNEIIKTINNEKSHIKISVNDGRGVILGNKYEIHITDNAFSLNFKEVIVNELNKRVAELEKEFAEL